MTGFFKRSFFILIIGILFLKLARPVWATAYQVRWGDTLFKISKRLGVPMGQLVAANKIRNPNLIYAGQRLILYDKKLAEVKDLSVKASGEVWVEINLAQQRLRLYQGKEVLFSTLVSTGIWRYPTPKGHFRVWTKFHFDDMSGGSRRQGDYYYLPKVPFVAYFYQGYALHGTYWHQNFGQPMSHGCVNLSISDAKFVYERIQKGTLVVIHA